MTNLIDDGIDKNIFPDPPKCADACPVHKKGSRNSADNYRPVSVLTHTGKVFEK